MTPTERAEKIVQILKPKLGELIHEYFAYIAAQVEEAREEGRLIGYKECDQVFKFSKNYKDAVAECILSMEMDI